MNWMCDSPGGGGSRRRLEKNRLADGPEDAPSAAGARSDRGARCRNARSGGGGPGAGHPGQRVLRRRRASIQSRGRRSRGSPPGSPRCAPAQEPARHEVLLRIIQSPWLSSRGSARKGIDTAAVRPIRLPSMKNLIGPIRSRSSPKPCRAGRSRPGGAAGFADHQVRP